jgi:hypothetical protein
LVFQQQQVLVPGRGRSYLFFIEVVMIELVLTDEQKNQWLNYETGYEQLHPNPEIIDYMKLHNYKYGEDWKCNKVTYRHPDIWHRWYTLTFDDDKVASTFLLKWS